ncbi:hypothetical protein MLD38_016347 [Melastoma candidum]|uniref:Uncharacterized protein n=1 Tax=Melastoma candidum TaxID=119954 RepID=A0ACB9RIV2_9MYRT|nr:hypothetical protein MLD38_016347 [Melastoma candidum]
MQVDTKSAGFSLRSFIYRYPLLFDSRSAGDVLTKRVVAECAHPMVHEGRCSQCNKSMGNDYGIPVKYLQRSLRISRVHAQRIRRTRTRNITNMKKLHLVLDLDNTLLHTIKLAELSADQEYLKEIAVPHKGFSTGSELFLGKKSITKLRPFVREFLREASTMFEMTVYTLGKRKYGKKMARLIDPEAVYFGGRVISRQDCTKKGCKSLDVVLALESNVVIIDDRREVWPNHASNLIPIEPYCYFSTKKKNGREDDEQALTSILKRLRKIHACYFSPRLELERIKDVRFLLQQIGN